MEFAKTTFASRRKLDGLKVVVDCANGAAYKAAPTVLWEMGAEVITTVGCTPNGSEYQRILRFDRPRQRYRGGFGARRGYRHLL